ncbi:CHAT domain-containing protein [Chloroflexi bacterium TSY]|nr:CHAT domain-containing protein [Chloroflexi bacterium TSY]
MIKILFLVANPSDSTRLRLDAESRAIERALGHAEFRDEFDIQQHWAVRVADLQGLFLCHQPDIVHFSGHGSAQSEIILEDHHGNSQPVSSRALSQLFSVLKDNIRCVVLNACYSESQAQAIAQHIDCVIGMSNAIGDASSVSFATSFYQALGFGRDVNTAFDLGRVQIDMENLGQEDVPQLRTTKSDPTKIFFVRSKTDSSSSGHTSQPEKTPVASSSEDQKASSGVSIGHVSGGITGSIIAGRDVTNATITTGTQSVAEEPTVDKLSQLLVEITANQEALSALSPANRRNAQGAEDNVKEVAQKVKPDMAQGEASSIQEYLAEASELLNGVLDRAKMVSQKAGDVTDTVQPLVEKLGPVVMKVQTAARWVAHIWL